MALANDYNKLCPLFDFGNSGGVLFPYFPLAVGQADGNGKFIDLDATASTVFARIRFPMDVRLITCQVFAVSDGQGLKTAAASIEPVIAIEYGTASLASVDAGTNCSLITCDATGDIGGVWNGTTTAVTISSAQELIVHLKTQAGKGAGVSGTVDGGGVPVLWFAIVNNPA